MPKTLTIIPIAGIGNRILGVISGLYLVYYLRQYSHLHILWHINYECSIQLQDILDIRYEYKYDNIDNYFNNIDATKLNKLDNDTLLVNSVYPPKHFKDFKKWVTNNDNITLKEQNNIADHNMIGLHCRRSDFGVTGSPYEKDEEELIFQHLKLDKDVLTQISNFTASIFISTDSVYTLAFFRHALDTRLYYCKKKHYPYYMHRNKESCLEAVIDLFNLSKCGIIIRDSSSSFGAIAHLFGQNQLITMKRDILATPCNGFTGFTDRQT